MKEDKEHIDNLFKQSLEQRTFEVPDAFMADINARLDAVQDKRKKRFPFILFILIFVGVGIPLTVLFYPQNQISHSIQPKNTKDYNRLEIHKSETHGIKITTQTSEQKHSKSAKINLTDKKDLILGAENGNQQTNETNSEINTHLNQSNRFKTNSTQKTFILKKNSPLKKKSKNSGKTKVESSFKTTQSVESTSMLPEKSGEKNVTNTGNIKQFENIEKVYANGEQTKTVPNENQHLSAVIDSTNSIDSTSSISLSENSETKENSVHEIQKENTKKWSYDIQLYGGIGSNMTHDSKMNNSYSNKLKDQQRSILTPSFGINGNVSYKKLTLGLGVSYLQTGEKYNLETYSLSLKDSTYSEIITDTIWVFDSIGGWTPQPHDSTIYHTEQFLDSALQKNTFKNHYSWLSIPISFGYRFEFGNYELIPRIGAQFNIGFGKNNGRYPTENFQGVSTYSAVKFNLSYLIQLEVRRNFNRWHIFVNPYFKSMINPAISNDLLKRRYSSWGIQFGVGLKL